MITKALLASKSRELFSAILVFSIILLVVHLANNASLPHDNKHTQTSSLSVDKTDKNIHNGHISIGGGKHSLNGGQCDHTCVIDELRYDSFADGKDWSDVYLERVKNEVAARTAQLSCDLSVLETPLHFVTVKSESVHYKESDKYDHSTDIRTIKLDDYWKVVLGKRRIDILKIDVEGYEVKAMLGAKQLLKSRPPYFIFSEIYENKICDTGFHGIDYVNLLEEYGYKAYVRDGLKPYVKGQELNMVLVDVVFVHREVWENFGSDMERYIMKSKKHRANRARSKTTFFLIITITIILITTFTNPSKYLQQKSKLISKSHYDHNLTPATSDDENYNREQDRKDAFERHKQRQERLKKHRQHKNHDGLDVNNMKKAEKNKNKKGDGKHEDDDDEEKGDLRLQEMLKGKKVKSSSRQCDAGFIIDEGVFDSFVEGDGWDKAFLMKAAEDVESGNAPLSCDLSKLEMPINFAFIETDGITYKIAVHKPGEDYAVSDQMRMSGVPFEGEYHPIFRMALETVARFTKRGNNDRLLVLDVGGNIGAHSLYLASLHHEIHTFEPYIKNMRLLHCSAQANRFTNLFLQRVALSNETTSSKKCLNAPAGNIGGSTLSDVCGQLPVGKESDSYEFSMDIRTVKLDDYWNVVLKRRRIDMIKIDVEGYEPKALQGSKELSRINTRHVYDLLTGYGYVAFETGSQKRLPSDLFERVMEEHGNYLDVVFVYKDIVGNQKSGNMEMDGLSEVLKRVL
ncbi:hypothetical protein HDU76_013892 [Blyttiomyces sp. JEL0837]|nr:hypothetical protein HDU76_013892 [Blyttiomyces sp. JEL0837]